MRKNAKWGLRSAGASGKMKPDGKSTKTGGGTDMKVVHGELVDEPRKPRRIVWRIAAIIIVVALACGGGFAAAKKQYENKKTVEYIQVPVEKEKVVEVPVEVKKVITGEIIRDGLRDIGELATEEYSYTEVGTFDSQKSVQLFGYDVTVPFTQSKFIYTYEGTIKAGVDFTCITVEKVDDSKRVTVTLPKAEILSAELDENSFQLYDEKNNIFNPFSVRDVNETNRTLKQHAEEKAIEKGLLKRADANAKAMIRSFLMSTYDLEGYMIQVKSA